MKTVYILVEYIFPEMGERLDEQIVCTYEEKERAIKETDEHSENLIKRNSSYTLIVYECELNKKYNKLDDYYNMPMVYIKGIEPFRGKDLNNGRTKNFIGNGR
jgi:hypothetical protein